MSNGARDDWRGFALEYWTMARTPLLVVVAVMTLLFAVIIWLGLTTPPAIDH